jgi:ABC-type transport system involved in multi-copper enzyme maturation permease subunit
MLWYKAWRESRMRFLLSAAIIAAMCLIYTLFHARLYPGVAHDHPNVRSYTQYIHWTIFGGVTRGLLQLSCLLLGLGGLQRDRKQNTLGFTLALPVSRISLVASRAALGLVQVLALSVVPSLVVTAASNLAGQQLPLGYALRFIPLWAAGGVFTFAVSFLASVLFSSEYVSLTVAYVAYMFYLAGVRHPSLSRFHLHVADFMSGVFPHYLDRTTMLWTGAYALAPIAGFLTAALVLVVLSGLLTTRQDL